MSGNPFRQRIQLPDSVDAAPISKPPPSTTNTDRKVKRVRIRTPPPLSPDSVHETTPLYGPISQTHENTYFPPTPTLERTSKYTAPAPTESDLYHHGNQPPLLAQDVATRKDGPQSTKSTSTSGSSVGNPFERTLENIENSHSRQPRTTVLPHSAMKTRTTPTDSKSSKQTMDVDSFKRLLLTGIAAPSSFTSSMAPSSSTVASTTYITSADHITETPPQSRGSVDETSVGSGISSPRTSYDAQASVEEEIIAPAASSSDPRRKAPPPLPKHRHGKLVTPRAPQTVSFADFTPTDATVSTPRRSSKELPPVLVERTSSDRSITVAIATASQPRRPSHESIAEESDSSEIEASNSLTLPNTQSIPVVTGPPLPTTSFQPRPPRPPRPRGDSNLSISSLRDFTPSNLNDTTNPSKSRPPPPPTRRPGSKPISQTQAPINTTFPNLDLTPHSDEVSTLPEARRPSILRGTSSRSSSISTANNTLAPPPPPPRRHRGSSKSSVELGAQGVLPSSLGGFGDSGVGFGGARSDAAGSREGRGSRDVISDLDALQAEIDALSMRYPKLN